MGKALKRCVSLHGMVQSGRGACAARFLECAEHGVWAIAEDLGEGGDGTASALLLDVLREQVASGEDLTAALLVAHGRVQRECESPGSQIIGLRLTRDGSSFEIAWVGEMQAHLVRGAQVMQITSPTAQRPAVGETQTNAFHMTAKRVPGLGGAERVRPVIDRKLGHAQAGDLLALSAERSASQAYSDALRDTLKGVWSLEYKFRTLKSRLQGEAGAGPCQPLLVWRGR